MSSLASFWLRYWFKRKVAVSESTKSAEM